MLGMLCPVAVLHFTHFTAVPWYLCCNFTDESQKTFIHRDGKREHPHHMRVLSLAIASSVGESIVHHTRAVKSDPWSDLARAAAARHVRRLGMRSPAHAPPAAGA